jgi:hypothetical protein
MVITLRVECIFGIYIEEECIRTIDIQSDATLYDLHRIIQESVAFDDDHLFEFYAGRHERNRKMSFGDSEENLDTSLDEIYPLEKGLKLYYLFDFGDSWTFKISKSRRKPKPPEDGVTYPVVTERIGKNPVQYPYEDW